MAATAVPDRGDDPNRRINVGKYSIEYGHNPFTGQPEAWAGSSARHNWGRAYASTMHEDGSISHGSRGTDPVPAKYVQTHIERTLRNMPSKKPNLGN
jgi:hypothetical protein